MVKKASGRQYLRITEAQRLCLELRKMGLTYQQIADHNDVPYKSASAARRAILSALKKTLKEPADELRKLEDERLDALWTVAYRLAKGGSMGAIDRCLKIMDRRAKLWGLDSPIKLDWRIEAERAGIAPSEAFETMVNYFYEKIETARDAS